MQRCILIYAKKEKIFSLSYHFNFNEGHLKGYEWKLFEDGAILDIMIKDREDFFQRAVLTDIR